MSSVISSLPRHNLITFIHLSRSSSYTSLHNRNSFTFPLSSLSTHSRGPNRNRTLVSILPFKRLPIRNSTLHHISTVDHVIIHWQRNIHYNPINNYTNNFQPPPSTRHPYLAYPVALLRTSSMVRKSTFLNLFFLQQFDVLICSIILLLSRCCWMCYR